MSNLAPKDHAEAVALFRSEIVGALTRRDLDRGELALVLAELSQQRFRPPTAKSTKAYSVATLERWYYAYKSGGIEALRPSQRSDRGRCRDLTVEQRKLLADIREEHPSASVPVILRTLVAQGRLDKDAISASSVRRYYQEQGLDRLSLRQGQSGRGKVRLRWQAERPGALWHADVCHGTAIVVDGKSQPVRIHGILDDASRYILALVAHHTEREIDMLGLMVRAVRKHGPPDALYLDNGSTYRGQTLSLACARMGTALIHAKPYDAPARGKMERFWPHYVRAASTSSARSRRSTTSMSGSGPSSTSTTTALRTPAWSVQALPASTRTRRDPSTLSTRPCSGKRSRCTRGVVFDATVPCQWTAATGRPTCTF
jgi:transposase InsO family protein